MKAQNYLFPIRVFLIAFSALVSSFAITGQTVLQQDDRGKGILAVADLSFQRTYINFSALSIEGNISFADMDNDEDLDIVYDGSIYRNSNGNFTLKESYTSYELYSSVADLNNDGYIDIVSVRGASSGNNCFVMYNTGSISNSLGMLDYYGIYNGYSSTGDFDNDGFIDLVFMIEPDSPFGPNLSPSTKVFRNDTSGTAFTQVGINVYTNIYGSCDWGDYDNDYDNDLLLTGTNGFFNKETNVLVNEDASYNTQDYDLIKLTNSDGIWCDYDSDGDLDIILSGKNRNLLSRIYRNDGEEGFQMLGFEPEGLKYCEIASGDLDNDGDVDILVAGMDETDTPRIHAYINLGNDNFEVVENIVYVDHVSSIDLGDFDKDGDLDLLTNYDLFRNTTNGSNNPPSVPGGLSTETKGTDVRFHWGASNDDLTPSEGLSYNLRVGTAPGKSDIMCPPSINGSPRLKIPERGNVSQNTNWQLKDLPAGTYYWSVQSIDAAYACSDFAVEGSFTASNSYFSRYTEYSEFSGPNYAVDAGDFDLDGDYDLIVSNKYPRDFTYNRKTYFLENTSAGFPSPFGFINDKTPELNNSAVKLCDLDNDEDLDLILSGELDNGDLLTEIYRNMHPNTDFQPMNAGLTGLKRGSIDVGDFDRDGDDDILVTGRDANGTSQTRIYRNEDMSFTEYESDLMDLAEGDGVWADLNNDGYLDIILSGIDNNNHARSAIYLSDGHSYTSFTGSLKQLSGDIDYADIDNDGYLEFSFIGKDSVGNRYTYFYDDYRQGFNIISNEIHGGIYGNIAFSDFDVDGRQDLFLNIGDDRANLFIQDAEGQYIKQSSFRHAGGCHGILDLDNDNDLDIYLVGYGGMLGEISYFENNFNWGNTPPSFPGNTRSRRNNYGILLEWDPASDKESIYGGLSYNVRIGTSPGANDIVSPMSAPSGKRYVQRIGNAQMNPFFILDNLEPGTYYWSVQAIDQSFVGGSWSAEESFVFSELGADFEADTVCQGVSTNFTDLSVSSDEAIVSWEWDLGDENISGQQNPQHIFTSPGIHTVKLTVRSSQFVDSIYQDIYVKVKPLAGFSADVVCQGSSTSFLNETDLPGISALTWSWDFDDGLYATVEQPGSHGYLNPGEYNVSLEVFSDNGCSDRVSQLVHVGSVPVASLTANGNPEFCVGDSLVLSCPWVADYIYQWKIGGVNQTGGNSNQYTAKVSGEYSVEVSNPVGNCMDISNPLTIAVSTPPALPGILSDNYEPGACQGEDPITLRVEYPDSYNSYHWMRNGIRIPGAGSSIYQEFLSEGDYSVEAIRHGCGTESEILNIDYGDMLAKPEIIVRGPAVWYLVCTNENASEYRWYLNEERVQNANEVLYVAGSQEGRYEVAISDGSSCFSRSDPVWIPLSTGIEGDPFSGLTIYPNPTSGVFTIEMDNTLMGELILDIYTESGSKIINIKFHKETSHFEAQVDLSGQPAGIYIVALRIDEHKAERKLVVE